MAKKPDAGLVRQIQDQPGSMTFSYRQGDAARPYLPLFIQLHYERLSKLNPKSPCTYQAGSQKHESCVCEGAPFLSGLEFSVLVQPGQGAFYDPTVAAQAA